MNLVDLRIGEDKPCIGTEVIVQSASIAATSASVSLSVVVAKESRMRCLAEIARVIKGTVDATSLQVSLPSIG